MSAAYPSMPGGFAGKYAQARVNESAAVAGVAAFLRGLAPFKTAEHVSHATGVPQRTVERWLTEGAAPSFAHYNALIAVYGLSVVRAAFPSAPAWLDDAVRAEQHRRLEAEIDELQRQLDYRAGRNDRHNARRIGDGTEMDRR